MHQPSCPARRASRDLCRTAGRSRGLPPAQASGHTAPLAPQPNRSPPVLKEKEAKQLLRSRRAGQAQQPGFPDEPMREYLHHLLALEHRAEEQFLEHWLNPHCKPHCDRNTVHPV
ncbi:LOW QUALITY PROTEIN: uncharacterized protein C17orf67 homolog [Erethizon dorsatum]